MVREVSRTVPLIIQRFTTICPWGRGCFPRCFMVAMVTSLLHYTFQFLRANLVFELQHLSLNNLRIQHLSLNNLRIQHLSLNNSRIQHFSLNNLRIQHLSLNNLKIQHVSLYYLQTVETLIRHRILWHLIWSALFDNYHFTGITTIMG